ncbi:MAG: peroxidase-related enzyme [Candidatus Babeliales bacterium]|nr:peroxidase-related enzyme [Candidatus Babeliales bacterium]
MMKLNSTTLIMLIASAMSLCIEAAQTKPHINLQEGIPGIRSLFLFRPETAKPLNEIVDVLLVNESPLTRAEREIIASYVSYLNECKFCCTIHTAIAVHLLDGDAKILQAVKEDYTTAPISAKLKSLLAIAAKVQQDAKTVSDQDVANARDCGATDIEIHDAVLIAAAFCMYNRYVDGLRTFTPDDPAMYAHRAALVAQLGYVKLNVPSTERKLNENTK